MGFGWGMIRGGFLSATDRRALIGLARDGLEEHRVARRANAIVLLASRRPCCWMTTRFATGMGLLSEAGSKR